jgi:O-methyltransferase involved in polyketide biosynthesis
MYDYLLGGKDNGLADRLAVKEAIERVPNLRLMAKENRAFLQRAVRYCTNQGIRQFVDVGAGLPTLTNTHEIAQKRARDARVVYVDNDPLVLAHGRAILARNDDTTVVTVDLRAPDDIINHRDLLRHIDWSKPVAVLLVAILHFIPDTDDPYGIVAKLRKVMAPGSHLVLSHGERSPQTEYVAQVWNQSNAPGVPRTREDIERFLTGFQVIHPGLVPVSKWKRAAKSAKEIPVLGAVGLKPAGASHG